MLAYLPMFENSTFKIYRKEIKGKIIDLMDNFINGHITVLILRDYVHRATNIIFFCF